MPHPYPGSPGTNLIEPFHLGLPQSDLDDLWGPQALAYGCTDSPVAQPAYLVGRYRQFDGRGPGAEPVAATWCPPTTASTG
ncbi:hypothetical protein [Nonomuraea longispora]|uniref:hypothetical protein n=1 Tax=Nonomuraea longispora TaxID=1848320 RepID=UPI001405432E|nr:hypothetical protein [Nonomuraea longispora]